MSAPGIKPEIAADLAELTAIRRDLHENPELGFEEIRTAGIVAAKLDSWGIEVTRHVGGTGVVGTIRGKTASPRAIGLRADMDALPMQEANNFAHASKIPGKMHGCGHDGHTTMLLGAAKYLAATRNFAGTVELFFQPAEEGLGGALRMIEDGLFDRFPVDSIYALHNWPSMKAGTFAVCSGPMMASVDDFTIIITGKGGHAAMPHMTVDPIIVAGHVIVALQTLISRNLDPNDAGVVTIGAIHGGAAFNVIPQEVSLRGTVRALSDLTRNMLEDRLTTMVMGIAAAHGASATIDYRRCFPVLINTPDETDFAARTAAEVFGAERLLRDAGPVMGSEDFASMLQHRPGAYAFIGQGNSSHCGNSVHNPSYDFNDEILPLGASYFARLAERALPLPS
jgi:hippurate hydrolase